jgi:hypothetical protein
MGDIYNLVQQKFCNTIHIKHESFMFTRTLCGRIAYPNYPRWRDRWDYRWPLDNSMFLYTLDRHDKICKRCSKIYSKFHDKRL